MKKITTTLFLITLVTFAWAQKQQSAVSPLNKTQKNSTPFDGHVTIETDDSRPTQALQNLNPDWPTYSLYFNDIGDALLTGMSASTNNPPDAGGERVGFINSYRDLVFLNNFSERMRLEASTGNFGIGTSTPSSKLHVTTENTTNTLFEITSDGTQTTVGNGAALQIESLSRGIDINLSEPALNGNRYGVYSYNFINGVSGTTTGSHYGGYFYTSGARTGSNYSVYAEAALTAADGGNWGVYCQGAGFITSSWSTSDRKLKQNIQNINGALDQINQLQPKSYTYDRVNYKNMNLPEGDQMGFIAQDLEQIFPSLIRNAESPEVTAEQALDSDRTPSPAVAFKAVNHQPLIALLTKGIQELSTQNEILQEQLNKQEQKTNQQHSEINQLRAVISELQQTKK